MKYVPMKAVVISMTELEEIVVNGACSMYGYGCINPTLFNCAVASFAIVA